MNMKDEELRKVVRQQGKDIDELQGRLGQIECILNNIHRMTEKTL